MKKDIELLAPAGGLRELYAAVSAGADAVYLGGENYNARMNAGNFNRERMLRAMEYAQLRDVKIYVTMNTLLRDDELIGAMEYASFLYEAGADALIIQDLGLASLVRRHLPEMEMHLSTQGTIYNNFGAKAAYELGFQRIVLARELRLEEIRGISSGAWETEVFVHGALCFCYSGQCQLSRFIGGRSGNRGACAQPCRLPYGNRNYPLSPKDLCAVDFLRELSDVGVTSLKIEGRMKSPEYVALVTSIYRKYLDQAIQGESYTVSEKDRGVLLQIFNRGGFTEGYLHGDPGELLMSNKMPKHQGIYIGKVDTNSGTGALIDVNLAQGRELFRGDGIEIHSNSLTGNVVTFLENRGKDVWRVGDIKGPVKKGDDVYKITDQALMKSAARFFAESAQGDGPNLKKVPIWLHFQAKEGQASELTVWDAEGIRVMIRTESDVEKALHKPLTEEIAARQLKKTGDGPFEIMGIETELAEDISLPLSAINKLRRDALEQFTALKIRRKKRKAPPFCLPMEQVFSEREESIVTLFFYDGRDAVDAKILPLLSHMEEKGVDCRRVKAFVPLYDYMEEKDFYAKGQVEFVPYISNISKGEEDFFIEENFSKIVKKCKTCGISIGNLGWLERFRMEDIKIYGDFGLNVFNRETKDVVLALGVSVIAARSLEDDDTCFGRIPLIVSEHRLSERGLTDRKGMDYPVIHSRLGQKSLLLSSGCQLDFERMRKLQKNRGNIRIYCYGPDL